MENPDGVFLFAIGVFFYVLSCCSGEASSASGGRLVQLDRSRSRTCTEPAVPALPLRAAIGASRLFQVFSEEFCREIQFAFRIFCQEFHADVSVILVVGNGFEECFIVDGAIL